MTNTGACEALQIQAPVRHDKYKKEQAPTPEKSTSQNFNFKMNKSVFQNQDELDACTRAGAQDMPTTDLTTLFSCKSAVGHANY